MSETVVAKQCRKCGETKPVSEFAKKRTSRDGLKARCKTCLNAQGRVHYRANVQQKREYQQANAEHIRERRRRHRLANLERYTERDRAHYRANVERILDQKRDYYLANAERIRVYMLTYRFGISGEQYQALLAYQGGMCAGCGVTECPSGRLLAVDHDHGCCPPAFASMTVGACGQCVRGLLCIRCNLANALAGAPHVDWAAVMSGGVS